MKIYTIGGYNKVGKNMTAIEVEGEIVIFDMGLDMEAVASEESEVEKLSTKDAIAAGLVPNDSAVYERRGNVKAIVIGHGHLDHVGAVPKLASSYDCPIIATSYTMKILNLRVSEDTKDAKNERVVLDPGERYWISNNLELEFISVTHSIPHSVISVLHTPEGSVLYSLDFRFDENPVLGNPSDYERLKRLKRNQVKLLIGDSTRVNRPGTGKSEQMIKQQLQHKIEQIFEDDGLSIFTTFSSHIERLNSLLQVNDGRRKVAFLGRSLKEYASMAEELNMLNLGEVMVASYYEEMSELLDRIKNHRKEWLLVCTGNQGEPGAALTRLADGDFPLRVREGDHVIFSAGVIPTILNRHNRGDLEQKLKARGATLHRNIHTSGHAKREDTRRLIRMAQPMAIMPAHGDLQMLASYAQLAQEEGYRLNENIYLCENGNTIEF